MSCASFVGIDEVSSVVQGPQLVPIVVKRYHPVLQHLPDVIHDPSLPVPTDGVVFTPRTKEGPIFKWKALHTFDFRLQSAGSGTFQLHVGVPTVHSSTAQSAPPPSLHYPAFLYCTMQRNTCPRAHRAVLLVVEFHTHTHTRILFALFGIAFHKRI